MAQIERRGENADESVARAGGVHRLDRQGGRAAVPPSGPIASAPAAPSVTTQVRSCARRQIARERRGIAAALAPPAAIAASISFTTRTSSALEHPRRHRAGRREVQDRPRAARLGPLEQREGRLGPHLVLAEQR